MLTYRRMIQTAKLPICWIRGHHYDTPEFHANALYFCSRCGREMLGRTFDDIEPMTDEEWEDEQRTSAIYSDPWESRP